MNQLEILLAQLDGHIYEETKRDLRFLYASIKVLFSGMSKEQLQPYVLASDQDFEEGEERTPGPYLGEKIDEWCKENFFEPNPYDEENEDEYEQWAMEGAVFDVLLEKGLLSLHSN